jgi:hypothetical protein
VEKYIRKFTGAQKLYDGVQGTVRHLERRLEAVGLLRPENAPQGSVSLFATPGSESELPLFEKFLEMKV